MCALKENKDYGYIPELQKAILSKRLQSGMGLPRRRSLRPGDPRHLGLLAASQPLPTHELVKTKVSRGDAGPRDDS